MKNALKQPLSIFSYCASNQKLTFLSDFFIMKDTAHPQISQNKENMQNPCCEVSEEKQENIIEKRAKKLIKRVFKHFNTILDTPISEQSAALPLATAIRTIRK